jgi:histidine ammonia-lyase
VELAVASAAIDLREGVRLGHGTARAYRFVRDRVPPHDDDRPTGAEFEALAVAIEAEDLKLAMAEGGA